MFSKKDLNSFQKFAGRLVLCSGSILKNKKNKIKVLNYKDRQDIVTNIDLEIEKKIVDLIKSNYPKHNIISEELGKIDNKSELTWVIDPLDGTKEFIRDIPLYCTAVSLETKKEIIVSAVYDPATDELYSASKGNGAKLNNKKISVSEKDKLSDSMLFAYLPKNEEAWDLFNKLNNQVYRIRGHANHNMSYCWVAKGGYEGHMNMFFKSKWWDIAPGILILREAGGQVTDLYGNNINPSNYKISLIGTNGLIHKDLLSVIKQNITNAN